MNIDGGGKRGRGGIPINPFKREGEKHIERTDENMLIKAMKDAVNLKDGTQKAMDLIRTMNAEQISQIRVYLANGKHTYDAKVRGVVEMIDEMKGIQETFEKLVGSHKTISNRLCADMWQEVMNQTTDGRFNIDVLKTMVKQAHEAQGGHDDDMMDADV